MATDAADALENSTGDGDRHLSFAGCYNFRDLGGYPTRDGGLLRWRKLFRADGLSKLDDADCATLADLGLRTVIDLRTDTELAERGSFPVDALAVEYHHLPLTETIPGAEEARDYGDRDYVVSRYSQLLREGFGSLAQAVRVLADGERLPAVFHCSAGKDRTGVLAAVVLGCIGVPDEVIVEDYALSAVGTARLLEYFRREYADAADEVEKYAASMLRVMPEAMEGFVDHIRTDYGGFDELAREIGIVSEIEVLRQLVVAYP
jgi:protein-tyrosine phosphatase